MKTMNSAALLEGLQADVRAVLLQAENINTDRGYMLKNFAPGAWSIAQVLEHLNIYARFYLAAIEDKLHLHQTTGKTDFKPGWLGNYFVKVMKPGEDNVIGKKMKAPKEAVPTELPDPKAMLEEFISHQHQLLNLLEIAKSADMEAISYSYFS